MARLYEITELGLKQAVYCSVSIGRESSLEFSRFGAGVRKMLEISHYVLKTKTLGPYLRSALWVHGCCFACEGCLAEEMNRADPVRMDVEWLARTFLDVDGTEGVTISGGEPFLQAEMLVRLLEKIKKERDYGVIVYTGFTYEELMNTEDPSIEEFLCMIDLLIDGKYIKSLDDGKPYRGSSNQRILPLSKRYDEVLEAYYMGSEKRTIEINLTENYVYMVGVPSKDGLDIWRKLKKKAGGENG